MKNRVDVRIHAKIIDGLAVNQVYLAAESPAFSGPISIMPDAHPGAGCVIGFTGRFGDAVVPNIVGVDIGCGVMAHPLPGLTASRLDFAGLDGEIRRRVPLGMSKNGGEATDLALSRMGAMTADARRVCGEARRFYETAGKDRFIEPADQIATLGGGNHFIECNEAGDGTLWLVVHTGSRNFGKQVADHFQAAAAAWCAANSVGVPRGLEYLPMGEGGEDYLRWMRIAQMYASMNRRAIIASVLEPLGIRYDEGSAVESVHNYIGDDNIIRKGAISARTGEKVIIPLNMAEGCVVGIGRGNEEYNFSAPHGAGRLWGRGEMKRRMESGEVSLDQFRDRMKGVFSTSVSKNTIDESPMAYKSFEDIVDNLGETVEITEIVRPVYNLKAEEMGWKQKKAVERRLRKRSGHGFSVDGMDPADLDR